LFRQHPAEIWQSIFNWCFEVRYPAAQKVALKVLCEVSKAFNKLTKNFQFLGTITRPIASRSIVDFCCVRAHHSLLLYALGNGAKVTEKNCAEAVEGGNLEIVKTILDRVWPINAPASDTAGEMKQFQLVVKAASGGHIEILKYLVQRFDLPRQYWHRLPITLVSSTPQPSQATWKCLNTSSKVFTFPCNRGTWKDQQSAVALIF
jgi:hypothetical protein